MDKGPYTLAYGIGGMTYGVSPTQLAAAYSILNREGNYIKPTTIKTIYNLQTNEILYQHKKGKNVKVFLYKWHYFQSRKAERKVYSLLNYSYYRNQLSFSC